MNAIILILIALDILWIVLCLMQNDDWFKKSMRQNNMWREHCEEMNDSWYEHIMKKVNRLESEIEKLRESNQEEGDLS